MNESQVEELVRKYALGTASAAEIRQLLDWYRSPIEEVKWPAGHADEREELRQRMLNKLRSGMTPQKKPARVFRLPVMKVAVSLIFVLGVAGVFYYLFKPDDYITVNNPPGRVQVVRLPDSSMVWLNASATLRYAKAFVANRSVQLQGEAYFEVMSDAKHPFRVETDELTTTVIGTSFSVRAYKTDTIASVAVATGKVKVGHGSKELSVLTPSQQLNFNTQTLQTNVVSADMSNLLAWKNGKLQFKGNTLEQITKTLERWYGVRFHFSNAGMRNCRYYMSFDSKTSLPDLLTLMAQIADMQYIIDQKNNTVTLSGKPCNQGR